MPAPTGASWGERISRITLAWFARRNGLTFRLDRHAVSLLTANQVGRRADATAGTIISATAAAVATNAPMPKSRLTVEILLTSTLVLLRRGPSCMPQPGTAPVARFCIGTTYTFLDRS